MKTYHFIGIGGIGMSALARILLQRGAIVQGSDVSSSYVTEGLKQEGASIFPKHEAGNVLDAAIVVYNTQITQEHVERKEAEEKNIRVVHRSEMLRHLMEGYQPLLVTGTHGKTTTSALLAHLFVQAGLDPAFAVGGVVASLNTNGGHGHGKYFIAEADESDGSFLNYPVYGAIVTNIEADHLDHWKSLSALVLGFKEFAEKVQNPDLLFWCADDPHLASMNLAGFSYGFSPKADLRIENFRQEGWTIVFDLCFEGKTYFALQAPLLGKHNAKNAAAVFGLGLKAGISEEKIRQALFSFQGVKRRMEKKGEKKAVCIYDDYAHHPTEIAATLKAVRSAVGEQRIIAAFQPHRYSRTRDSWNEFLTAFEEADIALISDIYPAFEAPIEGITGENLCAAIKASSRTDAVFIARGEMAAYLSRIARPHDIIVTMGAGDITKLGSEFLELPVEKLKVAYIFGGKSTEHEVSVSSADVLRSHIDPELYEIRPFFITKEGMWHADMPEIVRELLECDLCFPIVHGTYCEDGMLQGFFETLGLAYVGPDYRSGPLAMDKAWTKHVAKGNGVAVAEFIEFSAHSWKVEPEECLDKIRKKLSFPLFVKPVHLGSTFGVARVEEEDSLSQAIDAACALDYKFLVEEAIVGREMEFGFLGNLSPIVSHPAEVLKSKGIYTYEGKYSLTNGVPSLPKAPLPPEVVQKGREAAKAVYLAAGCTGLARIDFFLQEDGTWVLNEINPMPGCTLTSVYPKIWPAEGISLARVVDLMVIAGLHRKRYHDRTLRAAP